MREGKLCFRPWELVYFALCHLALGDQTCGDCGIHQSVAQQLRKMRKNGLFYLPTSGTRSLIIWSEGRLWRVTLIVMSLRRDGFEEELRSIDDLFRELGEKRNGRQERATC